MSRGAFIVTVDDSAPAEIHFEMRGGDIAAVPESQLGLMDEINRMLRAIRAVFSSSGEDFDRYRRELFVLAKAGLEGDNAQPGLARRALEVFRDQLTAQVMNGLKNDYLLRLGVRALILGVPPLVIALLMNTLFREHQQWTNFLFVWVGCQAGTWLSFGARRLRLRLDDVQIGGGSLFEPWARLIFAGVCSLAVGVLFSTKTVVLGIGPMETWRFVEHPEIAALIGLLCGFIERSLSSTSVSRARDLLQTELI